MNNRNIACLLAIVCGTLFGASLGMFAQGPDAWVEQALLVLSALALR